MGAADATAGLAAGLLAQEARGLLTRLATIKPFVLHETMVLAASLPVPAQRAIERFLYETRIALRNEVQGFLTWLDGPGRHEPPDRQQARFVAIRLRFNDVISQFDLFTEVVTQRSEHGTGVWLSGLDVLAADALRLDAPVREAPYYDSPPLVCYLARGPGAAIRRVRTRLPGGRSNPVGIIRVPRERMVGHGIASSLVHEVGHQGAALLGLVQSMRPSLLAEAERRGSAGAPWRSWAGTVSECVADLWSVAKLGVAATLGLMAVVSLPRYFVFRDPGTDPHPMPYLRVLLSAAMGDALYPHPQWTAVADTWRALYPLDNLPARQRAAVAAVADTIPEMAARMAGHRPPALRGRCVAEVLPLAERRPERLLGHYDGWAGDLGRLARQPPTLVFAAVGQARAAGRISPVQESRLLSDVLSAWAVRSSLAGLEPRPGALPAAS